MVSGPRAADEGHCALGQGWQEAVSFSYTTLAIIGRGEGKKQV